MKYILLLIFSILMFGCTMLNIEPAPKDCEADFDCFINSFEKCEPVIYDFAIQGVGGNKKSISLINNTCVYEGVFYNFDGKRIESNIIIFKKPIESCSWESFGNTYHGYLDINNQCEKITTNIFS